MKLLVFCSTFNHVDHKAFLNKLRNLGVAGPFYKILTEFLSNRLQRLVLMVIPMNTESYFWVYHGEVCLALYFSYCIPMMCGLG